MAATILNSPKAIEASVYIVRTFIRLREMALSNAELSRKFVELEDRIEKQLDGQDEKINVLLHAIQQLLSPPGKPERRIGFLSENKD